MRVGFFQNVQLQRGVMLLLMLCTICKQMYRNHSCIVSDFQNVMKFMLHIHLTGYQTGRYLILRVAYFLFICVCIGHSRFNANSRLALRYAL